MSGTVVEKFIRQTVNKLMNGFEVKSGTYVWDGGNSGTITNDSKIGSHSNTLMQHDMNVTPLEGI